MINFCKKLFFIKKMKQTHPYYFFQNHFFNIIFGHKSIILKINYFIFNYLKNNSTKI